MDVVVVGGCLIFECDLEVGSSMVKESHARKFGHYANHNAEPLKDLT